jgi:acetylornithine deacetylase/succinyl-diaminopimelate desuccinylase-like protein
MKNHRKYAASMLLATALSVQANSHDLQNVYQEKAVSMLKETVSMPTTENSGLIPELATYLINEFKSAGFDQKDIILLPMEETAALVIRYPGIPNSDKKPILLSAHMDVVEADPSDWERDPFTLIEENGFYFGRGSSDNKFAVSVLSATLMRMKAEGYTPNRDIILALSGDEETLQMTARTLTTKYHDLIDAEFALVADGGGGQLDENGQAFSFTVDTAEKTYATFEMTARNPGGHSSLPRKDNAIHDLTNALNKIFDFKFPIQSTELTQSYFSQTAPLVGGKVGNAMSRFSVNPKDQDAIAVLQNLPEYAGSLGTTCVPTMLSGGHAENALPQSATATINCRIFPGVGVEKTLQTLQQVVANNNLDWKVLDAPMESDASPIRTDVFKAIENGVHASYPNIPIIPHMASGASDALFFRAAGIPSYTFSGIFMKSSDEFAHGLNERVPVATLPVAMKMWHSILTELTQ